MDFYDSKKWLEKKSRIMRRDGYMCQISKRYGKMIPAELVHHIFPLDEFPEYALADWNLISVSWKLHNALHDRQTNGLSEEGRQLLERIARRNNIEVPEQYKHPIVKRNRYNGRPSTI
jgi:5-methylcytosine-specific restriction endonuclease McrA